MASRYRPSDDPMFTAADRFGPAGRAWRRDLDAIRRAAGVQPSADAMLASWIVEAPAAHPFWHSYNLTLVHLRPSPRVPAPVLYRPDATHELMLFAIEPLAPRETMLRSDTMRWLTPPNFGAQILEASDLAAIARLDATVDLIVEGSLNPDTDARGQWIALFGDAMIRPEYRR